MFLQNDFILNFGVKQFCDAGNSFLGCDLQALSVLFLDKVV